MTTPQLTPGQTVYLRCRVVAPADKIFGVMTVIVETLDEKRKPTGDSQYVSPECVVTVAELLRSIK